MERIKGDVCIYIHWGAYAFAAIFLALWIFFPQVAENLRVSTHFSAHLAEKQSPLLFIIAVSFFYILIAFWYKRRADFYYAQDKKVCHQ